MTSIGLDLGTGAVKGVCWNTQRGVLKSISRRVTFAHPGPDRVELDPCAYTELVLDIIRTLAESSEEEIAGISFAAASGNTLLCAPDGTPRTPVISWLDKRLDDWLPPAEWQVRKTTGWPAIRTFPLMHLEYFRRTAPELLKSSVVAMNNDFLVWRLCGEHLLDSSDAAPFYLWDQTANGYAPYLEYYGLSPAQLPRVLPVGSVAGKLKREFHHGRLTGNTRIVLGSFDHPAAARAAGILEPGNMLLSCGTSWVGFYPCATRDEVPENELCDAFRSGSGGCWGAMFSIAKAGVKTEEFICSRYGNTPGRYDRFNEEALAGDGPARALMLDVIGRFKERFDQHGKVRRLVVCGGPSEGAGWLRFLRERIDADIEVSPYHSCTGAVGAAMIAGAVIQ